MKRARPSSLVLAVLSMVASCNGSNSMTTSGTGGGGGSSLDPANLLSDFEDPAAATIVRIGSPPRNGYWYSYNDMSSGCTQTPAVGEAYVGAVPATPSPLGGGLALHGEWTGCTTFGAGVGVDINQPIVDGGTYTGPKVAYDLTEYSGITFWAMSTPGTDTRFHVKVNMTDETKVADGGTCDEAVLGGKCSDAYGSWFTLSTDGAWRQITIRFADSSRFRQEGWGIGFPWNPTHVTSIQVQSADGETGEPYDFWLDDLYLTK